MGNLLDQTPKNSHLYISDSDVEILYAIQDKLFHNLKVVKYKKSLVTKFLIGDLPEYNNTSVARLVHQFSTSSCKGIINVYGFLEVPVYSCLMPHNINLLIESYSGDLTQEILNRRNTKEYFSDSEIECLIVNGLSALQHLESFGIPHERICGDVIVKSEREFKFIHPYLLDGKTYTNLEKAHANEKNYLSPEIASKVAGQTYKINHFKCDVFALGLVLVECATLEPVVKWHVENNKFNEDLLLRLLTIINSKYSSKIYKTIREMVLINEEARQSASVILAFMIELDSHQPNENSYHSFPYQEPLRHGEQKNFEHNPISYESVRYKSPAQELTSIKKSENVTNFKVDHINQIADSTRKEISHEKVSDMVDQIMDKITDQPKENSIKSIIHTDSKEINDFNVLHKDALISHFENKDNKKSSFYGQGKKDSSVDQEICYDYEKRSKLIAKDVLKNVLSEEKLTNSSYFWKNEPRYHYELRVDSKPNYFKSDHVLKKKIETGAQHNDSFSSEARSIANKILEENKSFTSKNLHHDSSSHRSHSYHQIHHDNHSYHTSSRDEKKDFFVPKIHEHQKVNHVYSTVNPTLTLTRDWRNSSNKWHEDELSNSKILNKNYYFEHKSSNASKINETSNLKDVAKKSYFWDRDRPALDVNKSNHVAFYSPGKYYDSSYNHSTVRDKTYGSSSLNSSSLYHSTLSHLDKVSSPFLASKKYFESNGNLRDSKEYLSNLNHSHTSNVFRSNLAYNSLFPQKQRIQQKFAVMKQHEIKHSNNLCYI